MKNAQKWHLVIIDPQRDFCEPPGKGGGALFVPGADADMKRLAGFIRRTPDKWVDIHVTLDSHHLLDVAHPLFWRNSKGQHPSPFTLISVSDVETGVWSTSVPSLNKRMLDYVKALASGGRYPLVIWPPHCLIGTQGQAVVPELMDALNEWATQRMATIDFVTKGSNVFTEHYSAVRAEVPDPSDPTTHLNKAFIQTLEDADMVVWAGEASSHCVANTMRDTVANFGPEAMKKMGQDGVITVEESQYEDFLKEMTAKGMQTATTDTFLR